MSITSLLFPSAGPAGGLGATPDARPPGMARTEPASPPFSQWLQRAQPSVAAPRSSAPAPAPNPAPAASSRPPEPARPTADAAPEGQEPEPAAATEASAEEGRAATDDEASTPAQGELPPGAWWLMLPQPLSAPSAGVGLESAAIEDALGAAEASVKALPGKAKPELEAAHALETAAQEGHAEPATDDIHALAHAGEADLFEAMTPNSAPAAPLRGGESPGSGPMPWMTGLSPLSAPAGSGAAASAQPTAQQALSTPVHDPDFPEALAQSITVLTRQGIQEAQLHLNPAEMGTVSVHIAVSGQQAQVEFAASASATRAALEASLSHLAAALHSAGLTLTGGGVSQDTTPRRPSTGETSAGRRMAAGDEDASAAPAPRALPRALAGRLDLYA